MRYTSFYTIRELDYKTIETGLSNENISEDLKKNLQALIDDHKALIEFRKKVLEEQNFHASALFHLFDEPPAQEIASNSSQNNEKNDSTQNASENTEGENSALPAFVWVHQVA